MKEKQLRNWIEENDLPDQWWVSVNGVVGDGPVALDQALQNGGSDLQLCHVSRADENDWWRFDTGRRPSPPPPPLSPAVAVAAGTPTQSVATGKRKQHVSQSTGGCLCFIIGLLLSIFTFPIGLLVGIPLMLGLFAQKRTYSCTECGNQLAKTSEICPACRANITGTQIRLMDIIMIGVVVAVVIGIVTSVSAP